MKNVADTKLYLAGEFDFEIVRGIAQRTLLSYWYVRKKPRDILERAEAGIDLFLDSGAFTAFTQGVDIRVEDYAAFCHEYGKHFTCISNLDDTSKNERKSYDNQKALESLGVKPCPVFHTREDVRWLRRYIDEGYPYIFIGGMVPETTSWLRGWLDELFDTVLTDNDGLPLVKLHGFGLTDQELMFRYPWHSVDSTSWLMTSNFGGLLFRRNGVAHKVVMSANSPSAKNFSAPHYANMPALARAQVDAMLAQHGVTAEECAETYKARFKVNAAEFQRMELEMTPVFRHKRRTQQTFF